MDASVNRIKSSKDERAFLISVRLKDEPLRAVEESLDELKLLVLTAGAFYIDSLIITRERFDPAYLMGTGYVEKLKGIIKEKKISLLVIDLNLVKPAQVRNLEDSLKCRVISRNEIILDIFAKRARSSEASIQVELAQLRYILPRIKGLGGVLSRTGGGIGTRGPGEKMLETDRRHILKRISVLDKKLEKISQHRQLIRKSRDNEFLGAVVGYTNTGKSTLVNILARDDLFVEDRLFATLDAYTRAVHIDGEKVLLTDTVGFIRNLPANLIESFKSTLEEIKNADFLIHVVDINFTDIEEKIKTVNNELNALGCIDKPTIIFFNKSDKANDSQIEKIKTLYEHCIIGSAVIGTGLDQLKNKIFQLYKAQKPASL